MPRAHAIFRLLFVFALLKLTAFTAGYPHELGATPPGRNETGYPQFAIRSRESMGLSAEPTDIARLPDGRLLLFAGRQLAIGDGTRWDVFNQAEDDPSSLSARVVVDNAGGIYTAITGGFGKIVFDESGRWRLKVAELWREEEVAQYPLLRFVSDIDGAWYWHGSSGPVVRWNPGEKPRIVGRTDNFATILKALDAIYINDFSDGSLTQVESAAPPGTALRISSGASSIESSATMEDRRALLGSNSRGVLVFDGKNLSPLNQRGLLAPGARVPALARVAADRFVAAIQTVGIVFFSGDGNVAQFLSIDADRRLGAVREFVATPGQPLVALLEEGVAIVEYPSKVSTFEGTLGQALGIARPYRIHGDIWMKTDGVLSRGVYDSSGKLTNFVPDQPGSDHVFALSSVGEDALASDASHVFIRKGDRWEVLFSKVANLKIVSNEMSDRWVYAAENQIGWLTHGPNGYSLTSQQVPGLSPTHTYVQDREGTIWLELGNERVGRIQAHEDGSLEMKLFGLKQGLPEGWAQLFTTDGEVRVNIAAQIMRYSNKDEKFVPDPEFGAAFKGLLRIQGRPLFTSDGEWLIADDTGTYFWSLNGSEWERNRPLSSLKFAPNFFSVQTDGIIWMEADGRHARFDPTVPVKKPEPCRALLTHLELPTSRRVLFGPFISPPSLPFEDNSVTAHFVALGGPPFEPVVFEAQLGGREAAWTPVGSSGTTTFSNLSEGDYTLRVRPRCGLEYGETAMISFRIQPPWYRTAMAYATYLLALLTLVVVVAWAASYLQRRETTRLEALVARRTFELNESNAKLERQVEEIRRLSLAIEQSPVGVAITRRNGMIVFANPRFCDLFGYAYREVIGRSIGELRLQPFTPSLSTQIQKTIDAGEVWHGQLTNQAKDGHAVHVRTTIAPIRSPEGEIRSHLILEEDISEWLQEQDRRHKLESQLLQAQKLDALGTLAGGIAHDFNNILTGILGYCELAALDIDDAQRMATHLSEIKGAGLRAKDLVSRILTFSRQSTPTLAPLDLAQAVSEAQKLLRASTPATVEYVLRIQPSLILGDATQIHQVVVNLCTNAVHAMEGKPGRILVELASIHLTPEDAADLNEIKPGQVIRLTVSDNGRGMNAETLSRIFDPFFTTKQPGHGTGLGLAIVRAIVANHRGALKVRSTVGVGTTFELFFPATDRTPTASPFSGFAPEGDGQRILVVDDEPMIANFVSNRLRRLGYEVEVYSEPRDALKAFLAAPSSFTAVVTDLTMPGMTGLQLLQAVREARPLLPAVIVSGYGVELGTADPTTLRRCILLPKPFNGNDLARAVQQVLADDLV